MRMATAGRAELSLQDTLLPGGAPIARDVALGLLRRELGRFQAQVQRAFESQEIHGLGAARQLSQHMDGMLYNIQNYAAVMVPPAAGARQVDFALVATGGYGRGVLAPHSDIDLLFLTEREPGPRTRRMIEFMLYLLWDLGLKVGHATRSAKDCITEGLKDATILTALVDARFLSGEEALFTAFLVDFNALRSQGLAPFLAAKRAERALRHARYGESPFLVEPHVKEGRGGLRDLQTLYWLARYAFGVRRMHELAGPESPGGGLLTDGEVRAIARAWDFLWTLRFHLHYVTGRAEERLTFDLQPVIAARMGYTRHGAQDGAERLMKHLFLTSREVVRLSRVLEPAIERAALGPPATRKGGDEGLATLGLAFADGKLVAAPPDRDFSREPVLMLRMVKAARDRNLEIHPLAIRALIRHSRQADRLRGDPEASKLFIDLLTGKDAAKWLRLLNEAGFLGRFIPEWARIVGLMQFDTYHVFTVDEHTIEAIGVLQQIDRGELNEIAPVATELMTQLQSRRALYVATLLHDIAKGRGGDHSELGARFAQEICPRLGMSAEETETVSWLILHHLLVSQTAFKRDIEDPKTILDIADQVQSPERLRLLLVLTVADMRAVGPRVWNAWKATLLREVYWRVSEVLAGGMTVPERDVRVARAKEAAIVMLPAFTKPETDLFMSLGYPGYWLSFDSETHARHAGIVRQAEADRAPLTVRTRVLADRAVTEVTIYCSDHPGLFSRISGALAVAGASIVDARIHTLTNGMALDTFWVQDSAGGAFEAPHRLARLSVLIEQALSGRLKLAAEIRKVRREPARLAAVTVPPRVVVDNFASNTHTVIEVNGRDRPGLLHDVTAAISEQGLQIASAHITTYGVRAVDVFYVKDVFGLKVENERKLGPLRSALLEALAPPPAPGGGPSPYREAAGPA
ncbi:MAG: bifunctional uridylyltransferase/uridylyl-removing protein [Rubritepida sp.]|nr:bifunctional uridylyltransferase/uridylyl-removing protein [Rubritepida sp.]